MNKKPFRIYKTDYWIAECVLHTPIMTKTIVDKINERGGNYTLSTIENRLYQLARHGYIEKTGRGRAKTKYRILPKGKALRGVVKMRKKKPGPSLSVRKVLCERPKGTLSEEVYKSIDPRSVKLC